MKIIAALFMLVQLPFHFYCNAQDNYKEYIALLKKSKCISYDCDLKSWNTSTTDTTFRKIHASIRKKISDTLLGAAIFLKDEDYSNLYNGKSVFFLKKDNDTIEEYPVSVFGSSWITGFVSFRTVLSDFLENPIQNLNKTASEVLDSITEDGKVVNFLFNDSSGNTIRRISYFFNKDRNFPERIHFYSYVHDISFFKELAFQSVDTIDKFSNESALISQSELPKIKHIKRDPMPPTLKVGDTIPWFSGKFLIGDSFRVEGSLSARLTIIDFWFIECFPCLEAIPHLNILYSKYHDKGLNMMGLISTIKNPMQEKKLNEFSKQKPIDYPIAMVSRKVDISFKLSTYPTLVAVDSHGVIVYFQTGFGDKVIPDLEKIIAKHL